MNIEKNTQQMVVDDGLQTNDAQRIYVEENASLIYWYKPEIKNSTVEFNFHLAENAQLYFLLLMVADDHKLNIAIYLQEPHAKAQVCGYYKLHQEQQCSIKTIQHHQAPSTTSTLTLNGVLSDDAHVNFKGSIIIDQKAQFSNAAQSNKNLLFDQARAFSVPNLEVKTNEVQCKHGSAIGRLNDEQLFYLQSRGLQYEEAKKILADGFLQEVWKLVPQEVLQTISKKSLKLT